MARKQVAEMPVKGGVRRRRTTQPSVKRQSADSSLIEYKAPGASIASSSTGTVVYERFYVPGLGGALANATGPNVVAFYSTAKFTNRTSVRWEPSVSFTATGRLFVAFTDNPEAIALIASNTSSPAAFGNLVKGIGNVISFPVWQETEIPVPLKLRRRMFDVNGALNTTDVNVLDRSAQTYMCVFGEGLPNSTTLGGFHFSDSVMVEGLQPTVI